MEQALGDGAARSGDGRAQRQPARAAARPHLGPRRADAGRPNRSATARRPARWRRSATSTTCSTSSARSIPGATLDDVDVEAVERPLGRSAADDVRPAAGAGAGAAPPGLGHPRRGGADAEPEGAAAARRHRAAHRLRRPGGRPAGPARPARRGAAGELTGASRPWEYGDEQPLDVVRTVSRAVLRSGCRRAGAAGGRGLRGRRDRAAGVGGGRALRRPVLLDVRDGRWGPMKQTALALSHLVATRFPQDALQIIGFGLSAAPLSQAELAAVEPDYGEGHQPAARAEAGRPAPAQAPRRPSRWCWS